MPAGLAAALAWCGGQSDWAMRPAKRRRLAENLARATGRRADGRSVRGLVHRKVAAGARRAAGVFWAFARPDAAAGRVTIVDRRQPHRLIAEGHGVVLCSAHFGAFEAPQRPSRAAASGADVAVLTDDNTMAGALHRVRERMGVTVIPAGTSPRVLARIFAGGGVVVVTADLHRPGRRGRMVDFVDARCVLPGGPAAIAGIGHASLMPFAVCPAGPRRWRRELGGPIAAPTRAGRADDERRATQELADPFGAVIRRMPEQWDAADPPAVA